MNINVDGLFVIGKGHKICEDYITFGMDPLPHIILSDGCSKSDNTDVGARILTLCAKQLLIKMFNDGLLKETKDKWDSPVIRPSTTYDPRYRYIDKLYFDFGIGAIYRATFSGASLGLNKTALDATLIVSYIIEEKIFTLMYGDGYLFKKDDLVDTYILNEVKFEKESPYYLNYWIDSPRRDLYDKKRIMLKKNTFNAGNIYDVSGSPESFPYDLPLYGTHDLNQSSLFMISSDGPSSVMDLKKSEMRPTDVMRNFSAIKQPNGKFHQRRVLSELKTLEKNGFANYDDISVGAFIIDKGASDEESSHPR